MRTGELLGKANKAEFYYRQLITYEPEYGAGYLEFGKVIFKEGNIDRMFPVFENGFV